jgi:hypothetical protein
MLLYYIVYFNVCIYFNDIKYNLFYIINVFITFKFYIVLYLAFSVQIVINVHTGDKVFTFNHRYDVLHLLEARVTKVYKLKCIRISASRFKITQ